MSLLQPEQEDQMSGTHELPFLPSSLFHSQLVREGIPPFMALTIPRGSFRKHSYGGHSTLSSNQSFSRGIQISNQQGSVQTPSQEQRAWKPLSPLLPSHKWSTSRSSPQFYRRDWPKKLLKQHVNHYHRWSHSFIHQETKVS